MITVLWVVVFWATECFIFCLLFKCWFSVMHDGSRHIWNL
jgi:hypothetical protein